jgi:hypothetical protein
MDEYDQWYQGHRGANDRGPPAAGNAALQALFDAHSGPAAAAPVKERWRSAIGTSVVGCQGETWMGSRGFT